MSWFRPILSIFRIQLSSKLEYRAALWASVATNFFWGFVHVIIIMTFFRYGQKGVASTEMSMAQAVSYAWLVQLVMHILPNLSLDSEVREKIRSGDVGVELCRPLDLYVHWFMRATAFRVAAIVQRAPIMLITAMLLPKPYRLEPPSSWAGLAASLIALALGLLLSCSLVSIIYTMLMRITWGDGPVQMLLTAIDILAGAYLPLQLWPNWAQKALAAQPFAGILDIPLRFYVGTLLPSAVVKVAALQLTWLLVLCFVGYIWMRKSLTSLIVQGG